jgi:ADP-ribose pyrophosphatase YjhB (NUDIX family)
MRGTTNVPEVSTIIRKGTKILFVLRQKTGYADGMYALPGGHVEPQEQFSVAASREAKEEVGVTVLPESLKPVLATQRQGSDPADIRVGLFFEARSWSGTPANMEPDRHGPIAWFEADDLPYDKIMHFQAEGLRAIRDGKTYIELGWGDPA